MTDPRPAYPRTPAYGEGYDHRGPAGPTARSTRRDEPAVQPRGVWLSLGLSVAVNLALLAGVLVLGWPAGNVFLLFWCENAVLGLVTLVRILTAEAPDDPGRRSRVRLTVGSSEREVSPGTRVGVAAFFCLHYGIFCAVHLVFTVVVAAAIGIDRSWAFLGLPVVLLLVRYAVELATTWFGGRGLRGNTSPRAAMMQPYPRVVVLHLAVLLAFGAGIALVVGGLPGGPSPRLTHLVDLLPDAWQHRGVLAVAVLLGVKTVVDLVTTRRALRPR